MFARGRKYQMEPIGIMPKYEDLKSIQCQKPIITNNANFVHPKIFTLFLFVFLILTFTA
jgi:hypothetical protein